MAEQVFNDEVDESFLLFLLVAEQGVGLAGPGLPVGQDCRADAFSGEELHRTLKAVLVDVGVVVGILKDAVEAVGDH